MKLFKSSVILFLALLIGGCSNSSSNATKDDRNENPEGIWLGQQTIINDGVYDMRTIVYDGRFYGISEDANLLFSGEYETVNGAYLISNGEEDSNTSYRMYSIPNNGNAFAKGVMALDIKTQKTLKGAFENSMAQEGYAESYFSTLFERRSSLDFIDTVVKTDNLDLTINISGGIQGTKDGCAIIGNVEVPNSDVNIYKLSYTLSSCVNSGNYNGLGIVALDNNNSAYFMGFSSNDMRMESLVYKLENMPIEFFKVEESNISGWTNTQRKILTRETVARDVGSYTIEDGDKFYKLFYEQNGKNSNFSGVNFNSQFIYKNEVLSNITLKRADLKGAKLDTIKAEEIDFMEANLEDVTLQEADISGAVMVYANLKNAVMTNVNKEATSFSNAWWTDGTRCSADSIGECKRKVYENKMTYEEYLQSTSQSNEYIKKFEAAASEGQTFTDISTDERDEDADPAGTWIGYQSIVNKGTYEMRAIVYDGEFYGASLDANIAFSGTYETKSGAYLVANGYEDSNTRYKMYDLDSGQAITRGILALKINPQESLEGAFENDLLQEGIVKATFSKLYNNPSSLRYLTATVNTEELNITVDSLGGISGTKYDCKINGDIVAPEKNANIYKVSYTLSSCLDSGFYKGLGIIVVDNTYTATFLAFTSNDTRMEGLLYKLGGKN